MRKTITGLMVFVSLFLSLQVAAQQKTVVNSRYARRLLIGRHFLSLQWISWEYYGRVRVNQRKGVLYIKGRQKGRNNDDYLLIDGVVTEVNRYNFSFKGRIVTKISHNNGGEPCERDGEMTFAIRGKRKYWRLQEMNSPCENIVDYVDIFLRR